MPLARVLCVDDEPKLLEGLGRSLAGKCELATAPNGEEALKILAAASEKFDVVVSDMNMPGMTGAELLRECRRVSPDTVRVLLTGETDLDVAIKAVNEGHLFRFLTKPCPSRTFVDTVMAAIGQYRLITAERVLLDQTLVGSVRAMTEVLELSNPEAFGAKSRQHERARAVAAHLKVPNAWHVEVSSMLSQVGYVVLPDELLRKLRTGATLDATEREMLARVPAVVKRVISLIPRLESVRDVLEHQAALFAMGGENIPIGARILKALADLDVEEQRAPDLTVALAFLRAKRGHYDPAVLDAIAAVCAPKAPPIREIALKDLAAGMVLAANVLTRTQALLVARGAVVTPQLLERLNNYDVKLGVLQPLFCEAPPADDSGPARESFVERLLERHADPA
jgi:response regulator RpfG family c-di-GMP phosphodiesterase